MLGQIEDRAPVSVVEDGDPANPDALGPCDQLQGLHGANRRI